MGDTDPSKSRMLTGYLSGVASMVCGALSASCTQALRGAVPDFQLSVARSIVQAMVYMVCGKLAGYDLKIQAKSIPGLLYLGASYMIVNVGLFGATAYIPLAETFGVLMMSAIITAFLHSRLAFNKDIAKSSIISTLVCAAGIILATQPPWLFNNQIKSITSMPIPSFENVSQKFHPMNKSSDNLNDIRQNGVVLGYSLAFIGGVGFGLSYDIGGILLKDVNALAKSFYSALFCMIASVTVMFYMEDPVLMINTSQWLLVSGHAVLSVGTSFLTIQSAHYLPGPTVSALYCLEVIAMLVCQYTIMHSIQPGNFNWIEIVGCLIIVFGASIPSVIEMVAYRAKANEF